MQKHGGLRERFRLVRLLPALRRVGDRADGADVHVFDAAVGGGAIEGEEAHPLPIFLIQISISLSFGSVGVPLLSSGYSALSPPSLSLFERTNEVA